MLNNLKQRGQQVRKHIRLRRGKLGFQPKKTKESLIWRRKANTALGMLLHPNPSKKMLNRLIKTHATKRSLVKYFYKKMNRKMVKNAKYTLSGIIDRDVSGAIQAISKPSTYIPPGSHQGGYKSSEGTV
tara:strand:- start:41142 stop:41528 length:387 start_codon:yes stop_codon:yes gene_type:complete